MFVPEMLQHLKIILRQKMHFGPKLYIRPQLINGSGLDEGDEVVIYTSVLSRQRFRPHSWFLLGQDKKLRYSKF